MKRTPAIMLQGTGSDVGKTVLVAGLCRLFARRGLAVRPFKPQNMSNNAAVAAIPGANEFGEIGRAQWLQALACGTKPTVDMNPVLLKPQSETGSQVVVRGKVVGEAKGRDYQRLKAGLLETVLESYARLSAEADLVIVEGAGSPAEINLRAGDIANMGFATAAGVPVILVGDIDRGGVIASLVGTHAILPEEDRAMIVGFLINKFRGDVSLFDDGLSAITRFTGWQSFGVVPHLAAASRLPAEDSVALERLSAPGAQKALKIAVPLLGRIANFDDLDPLKAEPDVEVAFVRPGERLPTDAALVLIPGSKSTIGDLAAFRANHWDRDLRVHHARGGHIVGLCGGYQMLGRTVRDPDGIEGPVREAQGLGLLDVETVMEPQKTVREAKATTPDGAPLEGYEIHLGRTFGPDCARPVCVLDGQPDGAISADGRVSGTYLHGLFGADSWRRDFLARFGLSGSTAGYRAGVEAALDDIAAELERVVDVDRLLAVAREGVSGISPSSPPTP
ncbi:MAG: cobyric acid synthase [Aurantimonas endophytica]|uniref:Cobyric acid synthase n=1 Tax=Aurantimonas endophytica TaxID=1522175 RepID=A0A7W6HCB1_9HYPH|nr:cobyric acid synthase [Aurantimonas endophytica]MBB4002512.1 adenosylcobyric acid synthase [Aurantimonas endophytica]MCO6403393.1 cobyric acid synthase [Aurantimonas endophytica]